ncbi:hypothetical protein [Haliangium sp.]|uniref:hypothetical protein n=1 Tax=Haliangium sp. TaxID=2663208 RepID=UPI003D0E7E01
MDSWYRDPDAEVASRSLLLPRSGIGVRGPHLVIAAPGNPIIRLDARLLDNIELIERTVAGPMAVAGLAALGFVAGALSLIPGEIFTCVGMAYLVHNRVAEARRRSRSRDLLLVLGDLPVALHVDDEPEQVKRIVDRLSPYTRDAPITRPEVYEDARRRLIEQSHGRSERSVWRELEDGLVVGADVVQVRGEGADKRLCVGEAEFALDDVRESALRGANLSLPGNRSLQAALGLLVVAAEERARAGEDLDELARRIKEYEAWTGHTAGR